MLRKRQWASAASALLVGMLWTQASRADEIGGCEVHLAGVDAAGVGTFEGACAWRVAPEYVTAILTDPARMAASSSALEESRRLPDGRIVNVAKAGWPLDDRQSTLAVSDERRPDGGVRRTFRLASRQEPTAGGRVQVGVDEGSWEVSAAPGGGTRLVLTMRYEPGGGVPASLVHRMSPSHIAQGLDELRIAAEALARTASGDTDVASGPSGAR